MKFHLSLLVLLLIAQAASGHVPLLPDGNDNISSAMYVSDPEKSWAIYSQLAPGKAEYYSFDIKKGDNIYLSLLSTSDIRGASFEPDMALIGPGLGAVQNPQLQNNVSLSDKALFNEKLSNWTLPEGYGFIAVQGKKAKEATYEPFGPSSYYQQAELDIPAPESGRYYAAVYDGENIQNNQNAQSNQSDEQNGKHYDGHYILVLGQKEEYSFTERFLTPISLISVYLWEGQGLTTIITPWLVAALVGFFLILRMPKRTPFFSTGTMAGFLFLGTSASVLSQTIFSLTRAPYGPEVAISIGLAVIPALLGVVALRLAQGEAGILQRSALAVIGTIGLLAGSGFIIGPILSIMASVLPSRTGLKRLAKQKKGSADQYQ